MRLMEFASGRPDSRDDQGMDWLKALTNEQLATVSGWIEEATRTETDESQKRHAAHRR